MINPHCIVIYSEDNEVVHVIGPFSSLHDAEDYTSRPDVCGKNETYGIQELSYP